MKLTISTPVFQEMISKAVKGSSNNKMIPLTSIMAIQFKNNKLTVITTDATNYLYVCCSNNLQGDDFYVAVQTETFSKLISRMTSEFITLNLLDDKLEVVGNGKYNIELPLDEDGKPIKYPNPVEKLDITNGNTTVNLSTIKAVLNNNKPSLALTMEMPCYTGYYFGDSVITTDTYKVCRTGIKVFDSPVLISTEMMNLLDLITEEKIQVNRFDGKIVFSTDTCIVYGAELAGIEDFQVDAIEQLANISFSSSCKVVKNDLLCLLDRLSLFVGSLDNNELNMTFTNTGISLSSKQSSGAEIINYISSNNPIEFVCTIDIDMLRCQVKTQTGDSVEIWYGEDNAIKLVEGNVTQIIALTENESE